MISIAQMYERNIDMICDCVENRKRVPAQLIKAVKLIAYLTLDENQIRELEKRLDVLPVKGE